MGLFTGTGATKAGAGGGTKLGVGDFLCEVEKTLEKQTENYGPAFIAEFVVVESNSAADPVGAKRSWFQPMTKRTIALSEVKKFALACFGYCPGRDDERIAKEIDPGIDAYLEEATTTNQLKMKGFRFRATVRIKPPKEGSKHTAGFPNARFSAVSNDPPPVPAAA